jgi:hypothetical protein
MNKVEYLKKFFDENPDANREDAQTHLNNFRNDGGAFDNDTPTASFQTYFNLNPSFQGVDFLNKNNDKKEIASKVIAKQEYSFNRKSMDYLRQQRENLTPDFEYKPYDQSQIAKELTPFLQSPKTRMPIEQEDPSDINVEAYIREDLGYFNEDGSIDFNIPIDYDFYYKLKLDEYNVKREFEHPRVVEFGEFVDKQGMTYADTGGTIYDALAERYSRTVLLWPS